MEPEVDARRARTENTNSSWTHTFERIIRRRAMEPEVDREREGERVLRIRESDI